MAVALVQSEISNTGGPTTLASSVTAGNLIVVAVSNWIDAIPTNDITDNKSNTYTRINTVADGGDNWVALFYAKNVTGGASFAVSSSVGDSIAVFEFSGLDTASPLDDFDTASGSSTTPTVNTAPTAANEMVFAAFTLSGNINPSAGAGYTLGEVELDSSSHTPLATEYDLDGGASGSRAADFAAGTSGAWGICAATFKIASAATSIKDIIQSGFIPTPR